MLEDKPPQGWRNEWKYARPVILQEIAGIDRKNEPVTVTVTFPADRVTDLPRELRVIEKDKNFKEIPCQVYDLVKVDPADQAAVSSKDQEGFLYDKIIPGSVVHAQVSFLANMKANSRKTYYFFYGNPEAKQPVYPSDLEVTGEKTALTISNENISLKLSETGQVQQIDLHSRESKPVRLNNFFGGQELPIHWNPDIYAHPRKWTHPWRRPPSEYAVIKGPVFVELRRKAVMTGYPELTLSLSYRLYAKQAYFVSRSAMQIDRPVPVVAWRNDELVFTLGTFERVLWELPDGSLKEGTLNKTPVNDHGDIYFLPPDVPWLGFYRRADKDGFAFISVRIRNSVFVPGQDFPTVGNHTYITRYKDPQGGGIEYWFRALSYGFDAPAWHIPLVRLPEFTTAFEENAYLGAWGNPAQIQKAAGDLRKRLSVPIYRVRQEPQVSLP